MLDRGTVHVYHSGYTWGEPWRVRTQHLFFTAAAKSVNKTQLECQQPQHPLQHHQLGNVWLVSPARTDGLVASTWNKKELENLYWIHNLDLSGYWKLSRFHWMHVWTFDSTENQCSNHFQLHPKNIYIYIVHICLSLKEFYFSIFLGGLLEASVSHCFGEAPSL